MKTIDVPTGKIIIINGEKGPLECLSIGDYGKEKNIKADFMGLKKEINGVPHGKLLPLEKKWVITISTQYGCNMNCKFCDVPKVGPGLNATSKDMIFEIMAGIMQYPEVSYTDRLNLHFARMGEPLFNIKNIIDCTIKIREFLNDIKFKLHPVVSTMIPKRMTDDGIFLAIQKWLIIKNTFMNGEAGLQLSVNTTDEKIRSEIMPEASDLYRISQIMKKVIKHEGIKGRKVALNFAITDAEINADIIKKLFDPKFFMCKITPMHETKSCNENNLLTADGYTHFYPYKKAEEDLKKAGFDVIVFIPSPEEDISRITCGNAILSDKELT